MPEQYCNDLHAIACSTQFLAGAKLLGRLPVSRRCRLAAERSRRAPIATSCLGLTQQGFSPLNAFHRAPILACLPQHAPHVQLQRSQGPRQGRGRDVRAYIRAPVIPALESQPYREGEDKASQLQAGKRMYSIVLTSDRRLHAVTGSSLNLFAAASSVHSSLMLRSSMATSFMAHALLDCRQMWQSLFMTGLQRTLYTAIGPKPEEVLLLCSAAEVA